MKKVFFYLLASMFAAIMFITSCNPNNPDDEQNLDDNENEEEIVEDEIVSPDYVPIDWENASIISSNDSGDYSINFTGEVPSIVPGSVIAIDQAVDRSQSGKDRKDNRGCR